MAEISIIGGGIAGLVAAITVAEQGGSAVLYEANPKLGGTFEQLWPTFNPFTGVPLPAMFGGEIPEGQAREDFNSVVSNANAFIFKLRSGAAVTESEAKRLAPALPSIGLPAPINQVRIRNMTRFLEKNLEVLERRSQMVRDAGITDSNAEQRAEELQAIANQNPFTAVPFEADNDPLREALAAGAVPLGTTVHDIRDDGTMLVNVPGVGQRILRAVEE